MKKNKKRRKKYYNFSERDKTSIKKHWKNIRDLNKRSQELLETSIEPEGYEADEIRTNTSRTWESALKIEKLQKKYKYPPSKRIDPRSYQYEIF